MNTSLFLLKQLKQLRFNCDRAGHRGANRCKSRGCIKCKARHHTSLCGKDDGTILTGYRPPAEGVILPLFVRGTTLWPYLDTGSSRNFISSDQCSQDDETQAHPPWNSPNSDIDRGAEAIHADIRIDYQFGGWCCRRECVVDREQDARFYYC